MFQLLQRGHSSHQESSFCLAVPRSDSCTPDQGDEPQEEVEEEAPAESGGDLGEVQPEAAESEKDAREPQLPEPADLQAAGEAQGVRDAGAEQAEAEDLEKTNVAEHPEGAENKEDTEDPQEPQAQEGAEDAQDIDQVGMEGQVEVAPPNTTPEAPKPEALRFAPVDQVDVVSDQEGPDAEDAEAM